MKVGRKVCREYVTTHSNQVYGGDNPLAPFGKGEWLRGDSLRKFPLNKGGQGVVLLAAWWWVVPFVGGCSPGGVLAVCSLAMEGGSDEHRYHFFKRQSLRNYRSR